MRGQLCEHVYILLVTLKLFETLRVCRGSLDENSYACAADFGDLKVMILVRTLVTFSHTIVKNSLVFESQFHVYEAFYIFFLKND